MLVDLRSINMTGKDAANLLYKAEITVNKNLIPFDPQSPFVTSGIRIGTPSITTRGMKEKDMELITEFINEVINNHSNENVLKEIEKKVLNLCEQFPLYKKRREDFLNVYITLMLFTC